VVLLVGLHLLLLHVLAEQSVVATLFSLGPHAQWSALLAGLFMLVRILTVLVLPGFVLYRLAQAALAGWAGRGSGRGTGVR